MSPKAKPDAEFKPIKVRTADRSEYKVLAAKAGVQMQDFLRVLMDAYKRSKRVTSK